MGCPPLFTLCHCPYVSLFAWSPWSISCCGQQEVYPCMASMLPGTSCACSSASILGKKLWFLIDSPDIRPCQSPAAYASVNLWSESAEAHEWCEMLWYTHKPFSGEWESFADSKSGVTVFRWRKTDKITNKRCISSTSGAYPHQAILWSNEQCTFLIMNWLHVTHLPSIAVKDMGLAYQLLKAW